MSEIVKYWNDLQANVNTRDPIFKWAVFSDKETIQRYIDEIGGVLSQYRFNSFQSSAWNARYRETSHTRIAFSCLFLVRCALISRLHYRDWNLEISDDFLEGIGQRDFDRYNDWRACITNAERALKRSSLLPFEYEGKVRRFCARVLVEGGIPFSSLAEQSKILYGLKNVWSLRKNTKSEGAYERSVREFLDGGALESPDGKSFWLPGGAAGCRKFFGMGLELLENVVDESNRSRRTYAQVLEEDFGFSSPVESVKEIFGGSQAEKQSRAVSAISIKRILHWEGDDDDLETQVWLRYEPKSVANCQKIVLRNCKEEIESWTYDSGNHTINGNAEVGFHYDDVESKVFLDVHTSVNVKTVEMLQEMDFSSPIFFKHIEENDFEEIDSINERNFPLCAIIADEFVQDQNLDLRAVDSRKITFGDESAAYTVYKFSNAASLARSGLTLTRVELVLERPSQMLSAVVKKNGHSYRNVLVSTDVPQAPLRCWNSEVIYRENRDDEWNGIDDLEESDWFYGFFKLDTSDPKYVGKRIVVLPSRFRYSFEKQNGVITGISFGSSQRTCMQPTKVYVDGMLVDSPDSWRRMSCGSLIQCEFEKSDGSKLTLTIPSPIPGISWFYLNEHAPVSAFNYKSVKLHCIQNVETDTSFLYHIRLVDGETELLNFKQPAVDRYASNNMEMRLDLPGFLNRLFSATNSLNAKIEVVAEASFDGQSISTEPLIITRFDESSYKGDYFCFGLMSLKLLDVNTEPSEEEKRIDKWIKVPAKQSINGDWVWNGVNRIVPWGNDIEDASSLSAFQLMLVGNDYEQVKRQLHNYFTGCNYQMDCDVLSIISKYFEFCKNYNVPICNLWLLQMVLQDDRVLVQVPNIYDYRNLLDEKTFLCSFDWMLIRPDAIDHVSESHVRHLLSKHIESTFDENDESCPEDRLGRLEDLDLPELVNVDDDISSYDDESITTELRNEMHDIRPTKWKCALYFITTRVVYGTNEDYQKWHSWALSTLKLMKCVDGNLVRIYLRHYRSAQRRIFDRNRFHDGVNDVIWNEWKMGEVDSPFNEVDGVEDYFKYGKEHAYSRFYFRYGLDAAKKVFGRNIYVKHYGIPWNVIQNSFEFESLQRINSRVAKLGELYQVYKDNFAVGWMSVNQGNTPEEICVYPKVFSIGCCEDDKIALIAKNVGQNVALWLGRWQLSVDALNLPVDCEKLLASLKKMVPLEMVKGDLHTENEITLLCNQIAHSLSYVLGDSMEYCSKANSLRSLASVIYKNGKKELARDVFDISYKSFGDYMCAYDLYCVISEINKNDASLARLLEQSKLYLDSRFFNKKGKDAFKALERKVNLGEDFRSRDLKEVEKWYELSASLGSKNGYANLSKLVKYALDNWYVILKNAYSSRERRRADLYSPIEFRGNVQKGIEKCLSLTKKMTHHYRCAARLNCETVFSEYYQWLDMGVQTFNEVCRMYNSCEKNVDIAEIVSVERSISLIRNKIDLGNGWVYLRKAAKNRGASKVCAEWDRIKDSYCAKIRDSRDGQVYEIVNIDGKWWLAENLRFMTEGARCTDNGNLYSFDALPNVIIDGWRCPTKEEYDSLDTYCALRSVVHNPAGVSLKSELWKPSCDIRDVLTGTDDFGFNAKPCGMYNSENESIVRSNEAFFWTSSAYDDRSAFGANLSSVDNALDVSIFAKKDALALRLVCERPDFYELNDKP